MTATKAAGKPADGHSPTEYLQDALDELTKARDRAGDDIRSGIDSAIERTREAIKEAGSEAQQQVADWRTTLDKTSDDVRRELGILAVRAQQSPEALRAMSAEIRKRKTEISPTAK
jgi:F0F1-type ATP synthase membrane subunit b/b'